MSTPAVVPVAPKKGIVKQVLSGDSVLIRGYPKGGPPPEKQITFSNIIAPKLARRPAGASDESRDEPWAWEAREFLRSKLIGEEVYFLSERAPNSNRHYGVIYLGPDPSTATNVTELLVQEGLVSVRRDSNRQPTPELQRLIDFEEAAKSAGKNKWSNSPPSDHIRNIKWTQENQPNLKDQFKGKPVDAIIEHVRDGSTVRAFLITHPEYNDSVPEYHYITLMIAGIRCPGFKLDPEGKPDHNVPVDYANEARYFVESRLLQREVKIVLDAVNNTNFVGSIQFPKGNIAEALLREGFAKCVDWSMAFMNSGAEKAALRAAERLAKEKRLRLWKDYQSNAQNFTGKEKDFTGIVTEVFNGDAINVKTSSGAIKKVFLSSIRPPRDAARATDEEGKIPGKSKSRPLYDIPWMFECREFLRTKLIGKKVQCNLDYISPARDNFPEKYCYTVTIGGKNIAELLVGQGLATVVRYRQDDDQRSSKYEELLVAENEAKTNNKGIQGKKETTPMRINDLTIDQSRIKHQHLPSWQRALRTEAIVEFIASGSRFRLYLPKDSCLVTFLLAGISCPRSSRPAVGSAPAQEGEPFGDEALNFVREKILQRDVSVNIETTDKAATSVIGWLFIDNANLSVMLVEEGLATIHFSAEKTEYYRQLKTAEDSAKAAKKKIWANYVEEVKEEEVKEEDKDEKVTERKVSQEKVIVTEVTSELHFYAQHTDQGAKLETLMAKLRKEFQESPPLAGAYNPKRNDLCAAQFSEDNEWYRAKVEKVQGQNATILYIDYGNKEIVPTSRLASLPPAFISDKPYANYYGLALVALPPEEDDKIEAAKSFAQDALNRDLLLNVEYKVNGQPFATLTDPASNTDIGKALISDGILLVEKRRERKIAKLVEEYVATEKTARKGHLGVWEYGDITADDAKEFGRN